MIQVESLKNKIKSLLILLLLSNYLNAQCVADNTGNTSNSSNELLRPLAIGAGTYSQLIGLMPQVLEMIIVLLS